MAALDEATALKALSLIDVDYEIIPPIFDPHEAFSRDDVKIHEEARKANIERHVKLSFGDVDGGFAMADYVREDRFFKAAATHAPIEPHSALAQFRDGKLTLWSSTQVPHYVHRALAKVLQMPADRIRVIKPALGGGFGGKGEPLPFEFAACLLARKSGRPVKITYTREEVFLTHRGRHAMHMTLKTGVRKDGTITAVHFESLLDGGAHGSYGVVTLYYSGQLLTAPYFLPAYRFEGARVYTNKPPCGAQRGHGGVQPRYAFEVHLDRIAQDLDIDPVEIRLRNAVTPTCARSMNCASHPADSRNASSVRVKPFPGRNGGVDSPGDEGLGLPEAFTFPARPCPFTSIPCPIPACASRWTGAEGSLSFAGASDLGQGSDTMLALVAAESLEFLRTRFE